MIAEKSTTMNVTGSLNGDKVAMGIDQAAMQHIMSVLTDLYSDPELAVIREYSTNALDAHIEAGNSAPIEVDLPTPFAPFLKVRDYGIGLSVEDIHQIYSQYGASTKRQTNDQVGMLGLGCKSALTYSDQFTLVSVKDGQRAQVAISRDDDGGGSMTIVDVSPTDAPNGTEIVIPAKRSNMIESKAREFFRYWKPGTVLVNGKQPDPIEGIRVTDRLIVTQSKDYYSSQDYVVMGNVAYPAELGTVPRGYSLVAYVDIGSVNFTPSREALHDTAKTRATLDAVRADFKAHATSAIQTEIDKATTPIEAIRLANQWHDVLNRGGSFAYSFKGRSIPNEFNVKNPNDDSITVVPMHHHVLSRHNVLRSIPAATAIKAIWVHGYDRPKFTAGQKKKMLKWAEDNEVNEATNFIMTTEKPPAFWIDKANVVDWETIKAVKLPRAEVTRTGRIPGSYDMYIGANWHKGVAADDIDQAKPVFYFSGREYYIEQEAAAVLNAAHPGCTIVVMPSTRVAKFCRNFPNAVEARDAVRAEFKKWAKKLTTDVLHSLALYDDSYARRALKLLDPAKVDDPALKRAAKLARQDLTALAKERRMYRAVLGHDAVPDKRAEFENPLDEYPLFEEYKFNTHQQHTYDYLNAAYAARQ